MTYGDLPGASGASGGEQPLPPPPIAAGSGQPQGVPFTDTKTYKVLDGVQKGITVFRVIRTIFGWGFLLIIIIAVVKAFVFDS